MAPSNTSLSRGGQVYFLHDKVKNIEFIADMIRKLVPGAAVGVGHGQLEGHKLEEVMLDFIEGNTDVLVCTTIVENGLDIPNANIIVNEAQELRPQRPPPPAAAWATATRRPTATCLRQARTYCPTFRASACKPIEQFSAWAAASTSR